MIANLTLKISLVALLITPCLAASAPAADVQDAAAVVKQAQSARAAGEKDVASGLAAEALYLLGLGYEHGEGVARDDVKAAELYRLAWKYAEHQQAYERLDALYRTAVEGQEQKAVADQGTTPAGATRSLSKKSQRIITVRLPRSFAADLPAADGAKTSQPDQSYFLQVSCPAGCDNIADIAAQIAAKTGGEVVAAGTMEKMRSLGDSTLEKQASIELQGGKDQRFAFVAAVDLFCAGTTIMGLDICRDSTDVAQKVAGVIGGAVTKFFTKKDKDKESKVGKVAKALTSLSDDLKGKKGPGGEAGDPAAADPVPAPAKDAADSAPPADAPRKERPEGKVPGAKAGREKPTADTESAGEPKKSRDLDAVAALNGGRYYALVIGINNYRNIPRLDNAVNDAKGVSRILSEQYGFQNRVLLDEQATRDNIMTALNDLRKQLTENDSLLIYYSGHGEFNRDNSTSYWLPIDSARDDNTKWLEAQTITNQLKLISAKHVLIVADSCFSGTITRAATTSLTGHQTREAFLKKLQQKPSRVLIASGGNEPVADAGGTGHSVFTDAFLRALEQPFDTRFTAEELVARYLKEAVAGRTEQTPEYRVIRNSGHDGGDFIFVRQAGVAQ